MFQHKCIILLEMQTDSVMYFTFLDITSLEKELGPLRLNPGTVTEYRLDL